MPSEAICVLLVEADRPYADSVAAALAVSTPAAAVWQCGSLREASCLLEERRFDGVLLDLDLPDSRGLDAIDRIADRVPGMPIVALTSSSDTEAELLAARRGAQDYLSRRGTEPRLIARALRYAIERAALQAELARRERYFQALIEQAHEIIVVVALDGTVRYQSPATGRILGYPPGGLHGTNLLDLIHPDERERAAGILRARSFPTGDGGMFQLRLRHREGGWREFEVIGRPLEDDPQQGIVVNARDVTERVIAEEALRTLEARLRQVHKMEAVGRLAGGIAHDFNNVLTAIYGYSDLLLDTFPRDDLRRADVEEIRRSAERAAALTRQLLAFSRQQVLPPQVLDLNQAVEQVHRMLTRLVGPHIVTTFEPAPELWPVHTDRGQIEQVLLNLAANARDAMPEGGSIVIRTGNRTISAEAAEALPGLRPGSYVCLSVTDSGTGMPESVRRRAFEPFFTTKAQGQGTGLGLATVYGTVKQSGGEIYVDSEEHVGTTFTIYLPPHLPTSAP